MYSFSQRSLDNLKNADKRLVESYKKKRGLNE